MAAPLRLGIGHGGGGMSGCQASLPGAGVASVYQDPRPAWCANPRNQMGTGDLLAQWESHAKTLRSFGANLRRRPSSAARWSSNMPSQAKKANCLRFSGQHRFQGTAPITSAGSFARARLRNLGRPRAPRVRRGDLPRKATALPAQTAGLHLPGADPRQVARAVVASRKGER